ncbi:conjugal transfer protein [Pseudomonas syringae pv. syringae]|uniref:secretion/conjugation apparatus DotM-related subunit n=1 Tax=Pseudomonas syringae TaxID=317 RepID=UPI00200B2DAB|nr:conjugal transfer protein [Pseudomonas syringae]MCK9759836.1 conjugal transfer protein [Pseudomonas syringae pv. syringae]MCK9774827.1 conjugal transfer protein [Pseudomonas syringae pv. syringae]
MQTRQPANSWEGDQAYTFVYLCIAFVLCYLFFDIVVFWTSWILYWLWMMIDFTPTHLWVASKVNLLAALANNSKSVSFDEWLIAMNQTSGILFLFLSPIVLMSGVSLAQHPMLPFRSKRLINAKTLPRIVSGFAPSVIPIVAAYGPNGLKDDTSEANAWGMKPEEFAERHNLIKRKVLDHEAAKVLLEMQVGRPHENLTALKGYERALLTVFGLQVYLDDRKAATKLLDDLNRSCMVKGFSSRKPPSYTPLYSLADKGFARLLNAPGLKELLNTHAFVRTALAGLYGQDLRLPSARFRWLKGVDRTLWYALHSADVMKVYTEGAGVLAHTRAEVKAKKLGLPCDVLMVKKAIDGLQADLESIGLVHPLEMAPSDAVEEVSLSLLEAIYNPQPPQPDV